MPELPEVQTVADHVKPELVGEHILSVEPVWGKVLDVKEMDVSPCCAATTPMIAHL